MLAAPGDEGGTVLVVLNGLRLPGDGGGAFLHQGWSKADFHSTFRAAGAAIVTAFAGGRISVDSWPGKEFQARPSVKSVVAHSGVDPAPVDSIPEQRNALAFCYIIT